MEEEKLSTLESTPVVFVKFSAKADGDLIDLVKSRLEERGLIIVSKEEGGRRGRDAVIGITTTNAKLEYQAKAIRLFKKRTDGTQVMEAFDPALKETYYDRSKSFYDSNGLFSENERCLLISRILEDTKVLEEGDDAVLASNLSRKLDLLKIEYRRKLSSKLQRRRQQQDADDDMMKEHPTQSLTFVLERDGYIEVIAPIHHALLRKRIWKETLWNIIRGPPLELIHSYYGEEISFYFAWMDFLTRWSCFPGILGLATYISRWYRQESIMMDEYTPFYGLISFLWSVFFLKYWKRHEVRLSYRWGVLLGEYEKQKYFKVRPEFYGYLRKSPVTGNLEVYYPSFRRLFKYAVSALITIAMLIIAFWTMILSLNMQGYINPSHDPSRWADENNSHPFHWPVLSRLAEPGQIFDVNTMRSLLPSILHGATIFAFNTFYRTVATKLTKWENHETQLSFSNSLILKRFMFEAFDCYIALFYLAFYERDIEKLRSELVSVFNIDTLRRLALECVVPMILQRLNRKTKTKAAAAVGINKKNDDALSKPHSPLSDQAELDEYEQFDDYMEIIIQFGYVTLFASAYPLASLIMVFANLIEIRSDMFKLTFLCRKPRPLRCDGIGMWGALLAGIVSLSALTNCLIFGFTSGQLMEWWPQYYTLDESDHLRFNDNKGWLIIFLIFGFERALLYIKMLLSAVIPDVPEDVMDELERKHFVLQEDSRELEHEKKERVLRSLSGGKEPQKRR